MKQNKQSASEYYSRRVNNIDPKFCSECGLKMRWDCTRTMHKKCYRKTEEYKVTKRSKQGGV
jgi:hypothetical protein